MNPASTQYGDIKGTASGDWHPPGVLMALADLAGVDTTLDWPIGLKFWGTPPMIVSLFVVNITSIGEATFEALLAKTQQNPEQVSIREVQLPQDAPVEAHLKQFQAILTLAGIDLSRVELSN